MKDREVTSTRCPLCHNPAKRKIRWFMNNSKVYYSVSLCQEHGYVSGKIRIRRTEDNMYYVIKMLTNIISEEADEIRQKRDAYRAKKRIKKEEKAQALLLFFFGFFARYENGRIDLQYGGYNEEHNPIDATPPKHQHSCSDKNERRKQFLSVKTTQTQIPTVITTEKTCQKHSQRARSKKIGWQIGYKRIGGGPQKHGDSRTLK